MSFFGSIGATMRKVFASFGREIEYPALLPCAGNFTIGAALRNGGFSGHISGCDITLYTSAVGAYLSGSNIDVQMRDDCPEHLKKFFDFSDAAHFAASICLLLDMRKFWKNEEYWQTRELAHYAECWDKLMAKTMDNLEKYRATLNTAGNFHYEAKDAFKFLRESDRDSAVFVYPPTVSSHDFIKQERMLQASLIWQAPEYGEINFKNMAFYELIASFRQWLIVMEQHFPECEKLLGSPVCVIHKGRNTTIYAYASKSGKKFITRNYMKSEPPGPIFPGDARVTGDEKPGIIHLTHPQTIRLNELFMSARVDYILASSILDIAFCLDGKIIGKADFKTGHGGKKDWGLPEPGRQIYQQNDLAVASAEPRLSKLILLFILSHEVKQLLYQAMPENWVWTTTTAFSRHQVSMKYRGVYKLHSRLPAPEHNGFKLNYYAKLGQWSMAEAWAMWLKKYRK